MSDEITTSIRAQLDREGVARPSPDLVAVLRRGQRRRILSWIAGALAAITVVTTGFLAADLVTESASINPGRGGLGVEEKGTSPHLLSNGCPRSKGRSSASRYTSPTTFVAGGTREGIEWVLCSRTVERTTGRDRGAEGLCWNWLYGDGPGSGTSCFFIYEEDEPIALDANYFHATSGPEAGYFFGAVPAAAESVELAMDPHGSIPGTVHPAPAQLQVPFHFFTLFAEPFAEGTLIVRDVDGNIIRERPMEHGLSQLVVRKEGAGEGTVTGYRTDLLFVYKQCRAEGDSCREPRPVWIECGNDCAAALADARITLVAEPAPGTRFAGWSGACSGVEQCELVVDRDLRITAMFEPSS